MSPSIAGNETAPNSQILPMSCCSASETSLFCRPFISTKVLPVCHKQAKHALEGRHRETVSNQWKWPFSCVIFHSCKHLVRDLWLHHSKNTGKISACYSELKSTTWLPSMINLLWSYLNYNKTYVTILEQVIAKLQMLTLSLSFSLSFCLNNSISSLFLSFASFRTLFL